MQVAPVCPKILAFPIVSVRMWSSVLDSQLIATVKSYPCLYDLSHAQYNDKAEKDSLWTNIGHQLSVSGKCTLDPFHTRANADRANGVIKSQMPMIFALLLSSELICDLIIQFVPQTFASRVEGPWSALGAYELVIA